MMEESTRLGKGADLGSLGPRSDRDTIRVAADFVEKI